MEVIYGWIRNLTGFFLFMSVLEQVLPGRRYGAYIRLFSGMVLILLVLQPLTGRLELEELLARYYEQFVFQYQAEDLKKELLGTEKQRLLQVIGQYEEAVSENICQMASDIGVSVSFCQVEIGDQEGAQDFGKVKRVRLTVGGEREAASLLVEPVKIAVSQHSGNGEDGSKEKHEKETQETARLRQKLESYYGLEEGYVEIRVLDKAG